MKGRLSVLVASASMLVAMLALGGVALAATIECPGGEDYYCVGTPEDDTMYGTALTDNMKGSYGNDLIYGRGGDDNLGGGIGHDTLRGGSGADEINAFTGNDTAYGGPGADTLAGSDDWFEVVEAGVDDHLYGGDGNDWMIGYDGNDTMLGGDGDDTIIASDKLQDPIDRPIRWKDVVDCGKGHDVVFFEKGLDTVRRCEEKILIGWE
jgi:Ca2+-binding RTX toxin-like protein